MKKKRCVNDKTMVSAVIGRVNENGKYVEVWIDDIDIRKLPDNVQKALDAGYDIAIRLERYVSVVAFARDLQMMTSYLEEQGVPDYFQCFFEELSEYPPDVMWYYSNVSVTDKF